MIMGYKEVVEDGKEPEAGIAGIAGIACCLTQQTVERTFFIR